MMGSEVWSWGAGTHGQLASGCDLDAFTPQLVSALSGKDVVHIACGGAHAVAILGNGEAMTWGRGLSGALGHGHECSCNLPYPVQSLQGIKISSAAAGWNHTAFVTESGGLYTCGDGTFGQLGLGDTETQFVPCLVEHLESLSVTMVACGTRHTLALVLQGKSSSSSSSEATTAVYAFGSNRRGQLGIETPPGSQKTEGTKKNVGCISPKPQSITSLDSKKLVAISANGDHSAALTVTGQLYLWGRGFCNNSDMSVPRVAAAAASDVELCQVSLGWSHGLAISAKDRHVYAWGSNRYGQLGLMTQVSSKPTRFGTRTLPNNEESQNEDSSTRFGTRAVPNHDESQNENSSTRFGTTTLQNNDESQNTDSSAAAFIEVENMQEEVCRSSYTDTASAGCKSSQKLSQEAFPEGSLCLQKVGSLEQRQALWVAAGSEHSAAVLEDKQVMVWGWAEHGQLGLSTTEDQNSPHQVALVKRKDQQHLDPCRVVGSHSNNGNFETRIQCGSGFTFLLQIPCK